MIKKVGDKWLVDIQPGGRGNRRFRKKFPTKGEALRYQNYIISRFTEGKDWLPKKDTRNFRTLIDTWWKFHGISLKDGKNRKRWLLQICDELGNPSASNISGQDFTTWRALRLDAGNSINTVNNALAYLRSLFNELIRLDEWTSDNPFSKIRKIKSSDTELSFLTLDQIIDLLTACDLSTNPSTRLVVEICLSTGARWSEAESLRREQISDHRITFSDTKNGKSRTIPTSDCLHRKLSEWDDWLPGLFSSCYSAFRESIDRAGIILPSGQLSHVLRHTFASQFMMNGGNILVLQRALGHGSLQMTMRYAHFSPDHLEEVSRFNPLSFR